MGVGRDGRVYSSTPVNRPTPIDRRTQCVGWHVVCYDPQSWLDGLVRIAGYSTDGQEGGGGYRKSSGRNKATLMKCDFLKKEKIKRADVREHPSVVTEQRVGRTRRWRTSGKEEEEEEENTFPCTIAAVGRYRSNTDRRAGTLPPYSSYSLLPDPTTPTTSTLFPRSFSPRYQQLPIKMAESTVCTVD